MFEPDIDVSINYGVSFNIEVDDAVHPLTTKLMAEVDVGKSTHKYN